MILSIINLKLFPVIMPPKKKIKRESKMKIMKNQVAGPSVLKDINGSNTSSTVFELTNFSCDNLKGNPDGTNCPSTNFETKNDRLQVIPEADDRTEVNSDPVADFITSRYGNKMLVVDKYLFGRGSYHLKRNKMLWTCRTKECRANCYTLDHAIVEYNLKHNHPPDLRELSQHVVRDICTKIASEKLYDRPSKIVTNVLYGTMYKQHLTAEDIHSIKESINRRRYKIKQARALQAAIPIIIDDSSSEPEPETQEDDMDAIEDSNLSSISKIESARQEVEDIADTIDIKEEPLDIKTEFENWDNPHYSEIGDYRKKCSYNEEGFQLAQHVATMYNSFKNSDTKNIFIEKLDELILEMQIFDDIHIESMQMN